MPLHRAAAAARMSHGMGKTTAGLARHHLGNLALGMHSATPSSHVVRALDSLIESPARMPPQDASA